MFKKYKVPNDYLVLIKTIRKDGFSRFWDAQGATPLEVIEETLKLAENKNTLADLIDPEVDWIEVSQPNFRGNGGTGTGRRGNCRVDEAEEDRYSWARRSIIRSANDLLVDLERAGRYAGLWRYESIPLFPPFADDEDVGYLHSVESILRDSRQFQAILDSAPKLWARFQKRELRASARADRKLAREDRAWERKHRKAVKKGEMTTDPELNPEADMLDPHGDGSIREGDTLYKALMSNEVVIGNRTPTGWEIEKHPLKNDGPTEGESRND